MNPRPEDSELLATIYIARARPGVDVPFEKRRGCEGTGRVTWSQGISGTRLRITVRMQNAWVRDMDRIQRLDRIAQSFLVALMRCISTLRCTLSKGAKY